MKPQNQLRRQLFIKRRTGKDFATDYVYVEDVNMNDGSLGSGLFNVKSASRQKSREVKESSG